MRGYWTKISGDMQMAADLKRMHRPKIIFNHVEELAGYAPGDPDSGSPRTPVYHTVTKREYIRIPARALHNIAMQRR